MDELRKLGENTSPRSSNNLKPGNFIEAMRGETQIGELEDSFEKFPLDLEDT